MGLKTILLPGEQSKASWFDLDDNSKKFLSKHAHLDGLTEYHGFIAKKMEGLFLKPSNVFRYLKKYHGNLNSALRDTLMDFTPEGVFL